jgi:hypothetical protein
VISSIFLSSTFLIHKAGENIIDEIIISADLILWWGIQIDLTCSAEENWQHSLPRRIFRFFLRMTCFRQDGSA